ncbi:hypothetical protein Poli38472_011927 [Pythium oligandrum]|uniref:Uncharacterized protein n=1 Tax=Pythium oligandrum TaxID=41045 RepID=A0A8K1C8C7_PYTOL|nr:hypothetical protein Poli38472_011927 [Pythium oligandrum]|eukprot:TMW58339.1 hypothetical protein Poli38472_011927 [Pythium oligandrum]
MRLFLAALLFAASFVRAEDTNNLGAYTATDLNEDLEAFLIESLKDTALYDDDVSSRVCVQDIVSVEKQTVAGTNYRFKVKACDVVQTLQSVTKNEPASDAIEAQLGDCQDEILDSCDPMEATITVFEQPWTSIVIVSSIEFPDASVVREL